MEIRIVMTYRPNSKGYNLTTYRGNEIMGIQFWEEDEEEYIRSLLRGSPSISWKKIKQGRVFVYYPGRPEASGLVPLPRKKGT